MNATESQSAKQLATELEPMLKDESRWRVISNGWRSPRDFPFQFCEPNYYKWEIYIRSDRDNVEIEYHDGLMSTPSLRFRGKDLDNPCRLGPSVKALFFMPDSLASELFHSCIARHEREWDEAAMREALNPTFAKSPVKTAASLWARLKMAIFPS